MANSAGSLVTIRRRSRWLLTGLALVLVGCRADGIVTRYEDVAGLPGAQPRVLTELDYFKSGRDEVGRFLAAADGSLRELVERAETACVRISICYGRQGTSYTASKGTGILVEGGRYVLTAGMRSIRFAMIPMPPSAPPWSMARI